ncbi:MAG TPA: TonB-dependent receptor [Bryobacteraceae bacterium]|nr:TonB-dependent receptor [Bryobacteraceae bacterium]
MFFLLLSCCGSALAQSGFVKSGGQPIPGATITANQGDKTVSTVTDSDGHYVFPLLGPGTWNVSIEMFGFEALKKDVDFASVTSALNFDLTLKPSPVLQRLQQYAARRATGGANGRPDGAPDRGNRPGGFGGGSRSGASNGQAGQNTATDRSASGNENSGDLEQQLQTDLNGNSQNVAAPSGNENANESFLISGSLSPGMNQGAQADSGPDMRYIGGGPPGLNGAGGPNADTAQNGGVNAGDVNPGGGFGPGGPGGPGGGGFGGGAGGGGFGGRGGGGGGFGGRGGPGGRRPGQTAGATFGNRRRQQNQIHGQASFTLANSVANAKPFSINGLEIPQAAYAQSRFSFILNGPLLKFKPIKDTKTNFFISYFGTRARNPNLFTETVPTAAERNGDFSAATQSLGTSQTDVPVQIYNPFSATRVQFPNNQIPVTMLNSTALTLLRFYPLPNEPGSANNYQDETTSASNTDNLGVRVQRNLTSKDRLFLNVQYQRRNGTTAQPFGYSDTSNGYGVNTQVQWTRNISQQAISTLGVRFNRSYSRITPYFSTVPDIESQLNLSGASTNPLDFGPPTLTFTNFASLNDSNPTLNRNQTFNPSEAISILKGLHSLQFGGGYTRADLNSRTDPNARGTFSFTGQASSLLNSGTAVTGTGYDLADFLLGFPQSTSISYSEDTHYFVQNQFYLYAQDEWKPKANLTLILGVRYDYFSPLHEKYGRESNLDIAPDFTNVAIVTPSSPGPYTGVFPSGLINSDWNNFSPRLALAYKLRSKKSTLFRAGYGIYYNGQSYIPFGNLLANQSAAGAISESVNSSLTRMLTIADGFLLAAPGEITQTFAVARNYRTPYAGTWNANIQRDLGRGFFIEVGYLATKGTGLDVRIVPNQQPPGSVIRSTQLGAALAFTYDESVGNSVFESGHLRLVRRFNHGISINAFYQYGKSIDNSSTFGGAGNTTAQNWLDISAERGLSSFDIRHQLTTNFVYQSPIGTPTSRIPSDTKLGKALENWQLSGAITAQTGLPLTARALGNTSQLAQTGGTGSERAEATGESIESSTGFFNLSAFTVPAAGTYGDAGRNTIPGPGLFNLNLAFSRSFALGERRRSIEFRVESNNVLNHVNYTGLYTVVNAVNYGLPSAAGAMRTMDVVVRLRF